ncbi:MAG TPA: M23 family metallopeptidase [Castellaniella sp.]|uniref:M23 family metallopeptidase n=1 Tax=Castellaniella sp. TaxID=1955812 RepID=UPI002EFA70C0
MKGWWPLLSLSIKRHSSVRLLGGLAVAVALALSAWAGASWQAARMDSMRTPLNSAEGVQFRREAALVQGSLASLAGKLGELQGRVLAIEALRSRVAQAAGLGYIAPELDRGPAPSGSVVMDDILAQDGAVRSAARLGQRIDELMGQLARQEDAYSLADAALSRQIGRQASLPTAMPVDYPYLSSSFGWRRHPVTGRSVMHEGLDFVAPWGTPIRAASGGVVVRASMIRGYGRMVEIDHGNGLRSRYAHASRLLVKAGDLVQQGDVIARVGSSGNSTGPHLHFEIRMAGHPLDPEVFIRREARVRFIQRSLAGRAGPRQLAERAQGLDLHAGG